MTKLSDFKDSLEWKYENIHPEPWVRRAIAVAAVGLATTSGCGAIHLCCSKSSNAQPAKVLPTPGAPGVPAEPEPGFAQPDAEPVLHSKLPDGPIDWDNIPEYKTFFKGGEFPPEQRAKRTEKLPNGVTIFRDMGVLTFYRVEAGDKFENIIDKLSANPEFAYIKDLPLSKLDSFNILQSKLVEGMWIPIPLKEVNRVLSKDQLFNYCNQAIDEMLADKIYGSGVRQLLAFGRKELLAEMYAIGKQESKLGGDEYHRWEGKGSHHEFSFSLWHVLMETGGPGIRGRRKLNITEG